MNIANQRYLQNLFICRTCEDFCILAPIYQCHNGHLMCGRCRQRVHGCPHCLGYLSEGMRNFFAEQLAEHFRFPCRNKQNGCNKLIAPIMWNSHMASCNPRALMLPNVGASEALPIILNPHRLRNNFLCTCCHEFCMPPQIYQCTNGHLVCSGCYEWVSSCLSCQAPLAYCQRNLFAEEAAELVEFPCKFWENGCTTLLPPVLWEEHMVYCIHAMGPVPRQHALEPVCLCDGRPHLDVDSANRRGIWECPNMAAFYSAPRCSCQGAPHQGLAALSVEYHLETTCPGIIKYYDIQAKMFFLSIGVDWI